MPTPSKSSPCVGIRTCSDYSPFGVELDGRTVSNYGYRFGYQGSEKDNEFKGDGNSYTTEFRQLDLRLGRWLSVDPKMNAWESPYVSMANITILLNDVKGDFVPIIYGIYICSEIVAAYVIYDATASNLQHSEGDRDVRQFGYGLKHPPNALKAEKAGEIASNMSINISRVIGYPSNEDGGKRNAIRHATWNALMTKSIGKANAAEAANSHETTTKLDWNKMIFQNLYDADHSVDLRNNIIGRRIGEENPNLSNTEIAKKVLEEYHDVGLWTVQKNKNGTYSISKTKLSDSEYKKAIDELNITSNETGKHKTYN